MRIKWIAIYPNPNEISRNKYYEYKLKNDVAQVFGDGLVLNYTISQLKEFFELEVGNWEDVFKIKSSKEIKKNDFI